MLEAFRFVKAENISANDKVVLTYEERKKSRHRTHTIAGKELGWFVERGHVLEHGELLECKSGEFVEVIAADEAVSDVTAQDAHTLMRAAYHLGNRHVPLQVGDGFLRFQRDHVLEEMVKGLGLKVSHVSQPFHPESGAYSHGHGAHGDQNHSYSYTSPDGRHSHSHSHSSSSHSHSHSSSSASSSSTPKK